MFSVLDFRAFSSGQDPVGFTTALGEACRDSGVFFLTHHGIPRGLLTDVGEVADTFFALPTQDKTPLDIRHSNTNRGWAGYGVEVMADRPDVPLYKESFSIGLDLQPNDPRVLAHEPFRAPNAWPAIDMFRDVMLDYYKEMLALGRLLMRAVERDLDLHADFFQPHFTEPMATLRLSHYPANPWDIAATDTVDGPAQHDYGALTMVLTDGSAGIQVQDKAGQWVDVPDMPDSLLVLVGDCLMRWSNDQYRSAPHRILPPAAPRRLAAFYLDPNPDSLITPLPGTGAAHYAPIRAAEYLRARLDEIYLSAAVAQ